MLIRRKQKRNWDFILKHPYLTECQNLLNGIETIIMNNKNNFVHLHLHTTYSLLDGACRISQLMDQAKKFQMPSVAITDHGNMFGAIEFYQKAMQNDIHPIIGCEVYVAPESRFDKH